MEHLEIWNMKENPEIQELSEINEASINFEWENCQKIQGHDGFIPWTQFLSDAKTYFSQANIPYSEKLFAYLTTVGNLTVRLMVRAVSTNRPDVYKSFVHKGETLIYTGSGCVVGVASTSKYPCRCIGCIKMTKKPAGAQMKSYLFYIATATHAVYDDEEAKSVTVELHYNDSERNTVKKLQGVSVCERSVHGDYCVVECVTCDEELSNEIKTQLNSYNELYREFPRSDKDLVAIISHPHGKPKHISFGECTRKYDRRDGLFSLTSFEYSATTCAGSSGAPVLLMNDSCSFRGSQFVVPNISNHSGLNEEGTSCSSVLADPTLTKRKATRTEENVRNEIHGEGKNNVKAEANLHKHYTSCQKHPGHKQFIPVKEFCIDNLPEGYKDAELLALVRCLADLTGRLYVTKLSQNRPKVNPKTKEPYTLYDIKAEERSGTGCVYLVRKIDETEMFCSCKTCQKSPYPSKVFYSVYLKTAMHLVFDDYEARHTTFRVFYDNQDSALATINDWRVIDYNVEGDTCYLGGFTCDEQLGRTLLNKTQCMVQLVERISMKRSRLPVSTEEIAIIVSHPHSFSKHISVGVIRDKVDVKQTYDLTYSLLTYSTATCVGASGAPVFTMGSYLPAIINKFVIHHVHSDALNNGYNKCSFAISNFN